jgi:tetratricopeptide (TPR) repeat protein
MSVTSVNLLWQKKHRGLMAVGAHEVADSGHVVLICPDPVEPRTYQVLAVDPTGSEAELCAISVETVREFDGGPDGRLLLGMTDDDIYLVREGRKIRFAGDRRMLYSDVSFSPEAGLFICGWTDALLDVYGVALGDANGRLAWSKDVDAAVNRVALARDGRTMAAGLQDGRILALDNRRNLLWECVQPEPVTALAMADVGPVCMAGTQFGTLLALDEDGGFRWRSPVGIPVIAVATDSAAQRAAAVLSDGAAHLLVCLGPDGSPTWEYELGSKPTGIALSPNGGYLLVSAANGTAALFEVDLAAAPGLGLGSRRDQDLARARACAEAGDLARARETLVAILREAPHDLEAAADLLEVQGRLVEDLRVQARTHVGEGRYHEALELLDTAHRLDPWNADLFQERLECRTRALEACADRARKLEAAHHWEDAAGAWREALALDPSWTAARESLARMRKAEAAGLLQQGDEHQAAGDLINAMALWIRAHQLAPSEELEDRLRRAEVSRCVTAGIAYYHAGRMAEAVFQLKKALALEPGNEQAERYLRYAEGMTGDTLISDRFSRLE